MNNRNYYPDQSVNIQMGPNGTRIAINGQHHGGQKIMVNTSNSSGHNQTYVEYGNYQNQQQIYYQHQQSPPQSPTYVYNVREQSPPQSPEVFYLKDCTAQGLTDAEIAGIVGAIALQRN
ncbi:hypothetical protein HK099_003622 [Clydaea vesicula]|uniref:Uncharacterized protein n=1 Tax=Clydaea vesicula TaxID=447962 RepID=A0AAD5U8B2_9FUNG|nr:hypothetical protein HK099_003622 [Clydaea vesicula]